ncbi:MAG: hypothetical protein F4089_04060 [Gammaproteobacteria bacterium]|nr:hypothetical protein [Gammaproteobacteria bacterium]MYJ74309.1 hypothetical protein [Gammaproteobacteria bacterium]
MEAPNKGLFARSRFDELDKQKLRAEMYREQHFLCIYCEREIVDGYPAPRIDHWYPLSDQPELALHWNNLYLSCTAEQTCDAAKGLSPFRWLDSHVPWPVDLHYEDAIGFTSRGRAYVRSDVAFCESTRQALERGLLGAQDGHRVRRQNVNLNHPALIKARAAAIHGELKRMENSIDNGTASADEREEQATLLLERNARPPFVSIRVAWLRDTLGIGGQS